jgi:copper oxidase (laccase) domain-containing protein
LVWSSEKSKIAFPLRLANGKRRRESSGGKLMQATYAAEAEAAILSRLVKPNRADFSPEVASALLQLDFDQTDRDRMHELAVKNQEGSLTKSEEEELHSYRRIGYFVDLIRSKARISLKKQGC